MKTTWQFESEAVQQGEKFKDGSGETAVWTDGLSVGTMDHHEDNLTAIKLKAGKKYRVTVEVEEIK